jgi:hypothetical protein
LHTSARNNKDILQVTVQETDTTVRLSLEFDDTLGNTVCYTGRFVVLDMEHNDIIMGWPAIVGNLWQFFVASVEQRHAARPFGRDDYVCNHVDGLIEPWSRGPDELAQRN